MFRFYKPQHFDNATEFELYFGELKAKLANGAELNLVEKWDFCTTEKTENLLLYPFCREEFYSRAFAVAHLEIPPEYERVFGISQPLWVEYKKMIREWEAFIIKENHKDQFAYQFCIEARRELKTLKADFKSNHIGFIKYCRAKYWLVENSRYRYLVIRGIFELNIKSDHFIVKLNTIEVFITYRSYIHIMTRHYGWFFKPYEQNKDHFEHHVDFEQIHIVIKSAFEEIEASGLYSRHSINDITFTFKNILYRVHTRKTEFKGKRVTHLDSFYPLTDPSTIRSLRSNYEEKLLEGGTSVFVKR